MATVDAVTLANLMMKVGLISDGQLAIRGAVAEVFPEVPHQLCHCHDLREAAKPSRTEVRKSRCAAG